MSYRLPIRSVLAAGLTLATGIARAQTFASGTLDQPIPDGGSIASELVVQGGPALIGTVRVRLSITHSWDADLDIVLLPPGQLEYVHLASDLGGSGDGFVATAFDPGGPRSVREAGAPFTGVFRPEGGDVVWTGGAPLPPVALAGLHALAGRGADGVWQLRIADDHIGESGVLREWALVFAGPGVPRDPEGSLSALREGERVRKALDTLPSVQRLTLEVAFFEGLSYPEIAAREGIPLGTVKSRAARALHALKEALERAEPF